MNLVKVNDRYYGCSKCQRIFGTRQSLGGVHYEDKHSSKVFACEVDGLGDQEHGSHRNH